MATRLVGVITFAVGMIILVAAIASVAPRYLNMHQVMISVVIGIVLIAFGTLGFWGYRIASFVISIVFAAIGISFVYISVKAVPAQWFNVSLFYWSWTCLPLVLMVVEQIHMSWLRKRNRILHAEKPLPPLDSLWE